MMLRHLLLIFLYHNRIDSISNQKKKGNETSEDEEEDSGRRKVFSRVIEKMEDEHYAGRSTMQFRIRVVDTAQSPDPLVRLDDRDPFRHRGELAALWICRFVFDAR